MICPACDRPMVIVEHENIELDYCPGCQGIWFDAGELELLLEASPLEDYGEFLDRVIHSPEADSPEKKRKCPICGKKMRKSYMDEGNELLVDTCRRAHGIWFDGGEVARLLKLVAEKSAKEDSPAEVMGFLGDVFQH